MLTNERLLCGHQRPLASGATQLLFEFRDQPLPDAGTIAFLRLHLLPFIRPFDSCPAVTR